MKIVKRLIKFMRGLNIILKEIAERPIILRIASQKKDQITFIRAVNFKISTLDHQRCFSGLIFTRFIKKVQFLFQFSNAPNPKNFLNFAYS